MKHSDDREEDAGGDLLIEAARRLPRGIEPARDLWPGIAEAIAASGGEEHARYDRPRRWPRILAYAASALLLIGGSSGVTWLALTGAAPRYAAGQAVEPLQLQPVSSSFGGRHELGAEFMDARNSLALRLDERIKGLSPQARAEVEKNIAEIRASIQQINRVLADEPDNALLQELLLTAYHDELNMMRRVDGLISTVMRREDI